MKVLVRRLSTSSDKPWGRMAKAVHTPKVPNSIIDPGSSPTTSSEPASIIPNLQMQDAKIDRITANEPSHSSYMDAMKNVTDPAQHVKSIEEELQETVAAALGKAGDKVANAIRECEGMRAEMMESREFTEEKLEEYEALRKTATHLRWELTIHRQACGFRTGNHKLIEDLYKIPPKIGYDPRDSPITEKRKSTFGVQTDYWASKLR